MEDFKKGTLEYCKQVLSYPLIGFKNNFKFDFVFNSLLSGSFTMIDEVKELIYNGTFYLSLENNEYHLTINALDFYIEQTNGTLTKWSDSFEKQIMYLTKGLGDTDLTASRN